MGHLFQVGDWVTFLDEVGEGKVITVRGEDVEVLAGEFTRLFQAHELIHRDKEVVRKMAQAPVKQKDLDVRPNAEMPLVSSQPAKLGPLEIDLHLHELPPLHREATAHEKLLHQLDHARRAIAEARRRGDRRIVLIHGNGSGRLRHELEQMLRKDAGLRYFDASYQLFGQGALEVEILHRSK